MRPTIDELRAEHEYRHDNGRNRYGIPEIPRQTHMSWRVALLGAGLGALLWLAGFACWRVKW